MKGITVDDYFTDGLDGESVISKNFVETTKFKDFVEYLCKKDITLAVVKFIVSLRTCSDPPSNPLEGLKDYFGAYNEHKWNEIDELRDKIIDLKEENENFLAEIENLTEEIEIAKEEEIRRLQEAEATRIEAEAQGTKKGGAKKR